MRKMLLSLLIIISSCSHDDDNNTTNLSTVEAEYIDISFDEIKIQYNKDIQDRHFASVSLIGDLFVLNANSASSPSDPLYMSFTFTFDKNGHFISSSQNFQGELSYPFNTYENYVHFPANYFNIAVIDIDTNIKTVEFDFTGYLYYDRSDLNSEKRKINGRVKSKYSELDAYPLIYFGVEQYCNANINGVPWKAWFEHERSHFTSYDPYKIEINFENNSGPGTYNFNGESNVNYIRFSKFNTLTMTYDYYVTDGNLKQSLKEYMGGTSYNYIGTFNFTAVNPNNPSDIIQVTEGKFRSVQKF